MAPFLTAEWRHLAILSYDIDPGVLQPLVPRGTVLDQWQGRSFVSAVGFLFPRHPRPRHSRSVSPRLPEVNLRFYVRREAAGELRRAVVFVEIVPRAAIALLARVLYGEPYQALPMRSQIPSERGEGSYAYSWKRDGRWESLTAIAGSASRQASAGSLEEFVTEHYWGYTARRGRPTLAYRVEHPRWNLRDVGSSALDADVATLYGAAFSGPLSGPPASAIVADGSAVSVFPAASVPGT